MKNLYVEGRPIKVLKIAGMSILALGLVLGIALPALAASGLASPQASNISPEVLRGRVVSIDEEFFVIQSGDEELTIFVDENTRYFILCPPKKLLGLAQQRMELRLQDQEMIRIIEPAVTMQLRVLDRVPQPKGILEHQRANLKQLCHFGEKATFNDIVVGDKVVVWLAPETNGYLAKIVTIIEPTTYARINGIIADVSSVDTTITIEPADGSEAIILDYNERTVFILKGIIEVEAEVEQFARAIYNTETMIAKVVRVWPEVLQLPQPTD